jgi:DNA-binding MarR family transcriptional regulator
MSHEAHELAMALRGAYLTMHRRADAYLVKHGVTADQYVLLRLLEEESEVTQQTLVVRAYSDPNTVRTILMLLEGRGFVTRKPHPLDGRARSVSLTRKGRKVCQQLRDVSESFLEQLVADYQPGEVQLLLELLRRIPVRMTRTSVKSGSH